MRETLRLALVLTLIAAGAGLILAQVEKVTRAPIAEQRRLEMVRALQAVLPSFDNSPDAETRVLQVGTDKKGQPVERTFFLGRSQGKLSGIAFKVTAPDGYSGNIDIMVGIDPGEKLSGIEILSHAETPGLGAKIVEPDFKAQFKGRGLDNADWRVKKDGGDFDQITGATISPRAVVGAIRSGLEFYRQHRDEITGAKEAVQ
ncbi:MAG: RnfABCDGE type electron transport complex subunit G [Deltaproteobacteria bacterium]|nr:MAG: RnfABCDGE type electron transport complex subunit G [Deltaproteobacteria bacterium]